MAGVQVVGRWPVSHGCHWVMVVAVGVGGGNAYVASECTV